MALDSFGGLDPCFLLVYGGRPLPELIERQGEPSRSIKRKHTGGQPARPDVPHRKKRRNAKVWRLRSGDVATQLLNTNYTAREQTVLGRRGRAGLLYRIRKDSPFIALHQHADAQV